MTDPPPRGTAVELDAVLEVLPDALLVTDLAGTVRHVNPAASELLALTRETLEGVRVHDLVTAHDQDTATLLARWAGSSALRPGTLRLPDGRALRCDGARLPHHELLLLRLRSREAALVPFRQVHDRVETANLRELSRRLEASVAELGRSNRQLEAANDEIQQYARAVAHDVRTPLYTIQGYVRLLEHEGMVAPEGAEFVQRILDSTRRLADITDGVLAVANLRPSVEVPVSVDTEAVFRDVLADLDAELRTVDVRVVVGDLHPVAVPEPALRRVLQNLVGNSLRHGAVPDRPLVVEVSSRVVGSEVQLAVRDDGRGVDPADREHVFTLFYRGTTGAASPGSGIGLSSCRKLVNGWGGTITCEPVAGPGALFVVTAPAARVPPDDQVGARPVS